MVKDKALSLIKKMLYLRIKYLIRKSFIQAEATHRLSNGSLKLDGSVDYVAKKSLLLPCFKPLLKQVLEEDFKNHNDFINNLIIRERILI